MELLKAYLPRDHEIDWFACTHWGNPHQHTEAISERIAKIAKRKHHYIVVVGDIAEAINPLDKRFEWDGHRMSITEQYNAAIDAFRPVARRILAVCTGNHDAKLRSTGDMVRDVFCKTLNVPYGTQSCKLIINDVKSNDLQYKVYMTHPDNGTIRSSHPDPIMREAAEKVQLKRRLTRERMADCILNIAAHFHKAISVEPFQELYLVDDGDKIKQRYKAEADAHAEYIDEDLRWYGSVPGWIKKYSLGRSGYVERAGYAPLPIGSLKTVVRNGKIVNMEKKLIQ